jgi:glycosyltransferase involved in cell wall biosynthesis
VDTELFKPTFKPFNDPPIVGWSGSIKYWGVNVKGVNYIKKACEKAGYPFRPAIVEKKRRTQREMVDYYNSIDIYVDASRSAGRQNGILEAGACAKTVLATDTGITKQIIRNEHNGLVIKRKHIAEALKKATPEMGRRLYDDVLREWTWKRHAERIDEVFKCLN